MKAPNLAAFSSKRDGGVGTWHRVREVPISRLRSCGTGFEVLEWGKDREKWRNTGLRLPFRMFDTI